MSNITLEHARKLYEESLLHSVPHIAEMAGMHPRTLQKRAAREGWKRRDNPAQAGVTPPAAPAQVHHPSKGRKIATRRSGDTVSYLVRNVPTDLWTEFRVALSDHGIEVKDAFLGFITRTAKGAEYRPKED